MSLAPPCAAQCGVLLRVDNLISDWKYAASQRNECFEGNGICEHNYWYLSDKKKVSIGVSEIAMTGEREKQTGYKEEAFHV